MSSRATGNLTKKKNSSNSIGKASKSVTIELSSDDDIKELVSGFPKKRGENKVASSSNRKPAVKRNVGASQATGFGRLVSAFDSHELASTSGSSSSTAASASISSFFKPPPSKSRPSHHGSTSRLQHPATSSAQPRRSRKASEEAIVMDIASSPPIDDLTWESSDPEIQIVASSSSSAKVGGRQSVSDRGVKRKRNENKIEARQSNDEIALEGDDTISSMWTDRYAPQTITELAPSKPRIASLRSWLEEALHGRPSGLDRNIAFSKQAADRVRKYRRILLLTGPAGAGKSTSVRVVAKELGVQVIEWNEGFEEWGLGAHVERESLTSKLITFLSRNTYSSLPVTESGSASIPPTSANAPRALLITSLPNLSHYATRQAFHKALVDYAGTFMPSSCPLIVVVPDTGHSGAAEEPWSDRGGAGGSSDNVWDLRSVVGEDVLASPAVTTIGFLPVAPTFAAKALKRILELAIPNASQRPHKDVIGLLAQSCNGDLRSAVNSLEMLMKSADARSLGGNGPASLPKKGKGSRGGKGKSSGSKEMQDLLNQIARREQSLGLFHALGKVLYNKRVGENTDGDPELEAKALANERQYLRDNPLPSHLAQHGRPRYENDFEDLLSSAPLDTASFMLWMHQNMPQFCREIDETDQCLEAICDADRMKTDDESWQRSPQAIAYAFHVAVRGVVAGLPSPVPKNHQKMFKPDFFRWVKVGKINQSVVDDTSRWIADNSREIRSSEIGTQEDDPDSNQSNVYRGQRSRAVLATEFLPMIRLLKRRGTKIPIRIDDEPFTSLDDNLNELSILDEKDNGAATEGPDGDDLIETIGSALGQSGRASRDSIVDDEPLEPGTIASYLPDDDIEDD